MIRARLLRRLIRPFNWHKNGACRFPVLCMYDDMLIWELDGIDKRRATWKRAKAFRAEIDETFARFMRGERGITRRPLSPTAEATVPNTGSQGSNP